MSLLVAEIDVPGSFVREIVSVTSSHGLAVAVPTSSEGLASALATHSIKNRVTINSPPQR